MDGPALALLELSSVARGIVTVDAMVKRASVEVRDARSVSPGRYLVRVAGGVGEVEEAWRAGLQAADVALLDEVFLPNPHPALLALLEGRPQAAPIDAVGLVECYTSASAVRAADATAKAVEIALTRLELGNGLGGKGWFLFTGALHEVEAGLSAAAEAVREGMLLTTECIARPHPDTGPIL
ncbi:MAG: BMC domain-containing protein [Deltaproteobacteria bacterium]|nr:MAG: BMC domain-containing protein [Deltaproteobacteria bacterium]